MCKKAALLILVAPAVVAAATTDISVLPATTTFRYTIGAALPASQTLQIKSTGTNFSVTLAVGGPAPYAGGWLSVAATTATTPASVKLYANPTGLSAGSYTATITLTAAAAGNSPVACTVTLAVGDAPPTLSATPSTLSFDTASGGLTQTVMLSSTGGPLSATIKVSGAAWLKASPTGSIALVGLPSPVTVTVDPTGLAPGTYTAKVSFTSTTAANANLDVAISFIVRAAAPAITGSWPAGLGVRPSGTTLAPPVITLNGTNFYSTTTVTIGGSTVTSTVLSSTAILVTVPNELLTTAGATLSIKVTTPPPGGGTSTAYSLPVWPAGPVILAVVSVASYSATALSPGEILAIYGVGLGPATLSVAVPTGTTLPTSWPATGAATSVTIDGRAAPILYTSSSVVSCIVPYAVAAKVGPAATVPVVVTYGTPSSPKDVPLAATHPGVFTLDASGSGQGAILNYNATTSDYTVNSSSNAILRGATAVLYVTGFGQTSPTGTETALISGAVTPVATPTMTIEGQSATVQAAAAPANSYPGVLQINFTVPAGGKSNNAAPVVVTVGGVDSQTVTMAIK
jgi:uncharacterized protein (TIGR03437 family)